MAQPLHGITGEQQRELRAMLVRLSSLWAELTAAAIRQDQARVDALTREIGMCRERVETIKRQGTEGTA